MSGSRLYFWLFCGCLVLLLVPVWVVDQIPLPDIPINMARGYLMRHFGDGSAAVAHVSLAKELVPNSAFDLLVPPVLGVVSLERATQGFVTLYLLLFAFGCHWLGRAVTGRGAGFGPPHFAVLPCLFLSYQSPFLYGYLNYSAGIALAILTLGLRAGWAARWTAVRLGVLTILCTGVFLFHLSAAAILAVGWVVWSGWEAREEGPRRWWAVGSLAEFVPSFLLYLRLDRGGSSLTAWATPTQKVLHLFGGFISYSVPPTVLAIAVAGGAIVVALWFSRHAFRQPVGLAGAVMMGIYVAAPDAFHNATDTDTRFVAVAILLIVLACEIPARLLRTGYLLVGLSLGAMAVRQVDIIRHWRVASGEWTEQMASLDAVPVGSVLYFLVRTNPDPLVSKRERHFENFPGLAVGRRGVELPKLTSYPTETWAISMNHVFPDVYLGDDKPLSSLDWKRLRGEKSYLWTYGFSAQDLRDMEGLSTRVYSSGRVQVFHLKDW